MQDLITVKNVRFSGALGLEGEKIDVLSSTWSTLVLKVHETRTSKKKEECNLKLFWIKVSYGDVIER